jgi:hypothetical protein
MDDQSSNSLTVVQTMGRNGAKGMGMAKLHPPAQDVPKLGRFCVVVTDGGSREHACIAKVRFDDAVPAGQCALDSNVRHALGLEAGMRVTLRPVSRRWLRAGPLPLARTYGVGLGFLIRPRSLTLPVHQPDWLDSEKNICVLHSRSIRLLGLAEGEFVRILSLAKVAGGYEIRKITLRVSEGSPRQQAGSGGAGGAASMSRQYPATGEIYIDKEWRQRLGLLRPDPVVVVPNIARLIAGRSLLYGITVFLGISAILEVLRALLPGRTVLDASLALVTATVGTIGLAWLDIRGRVRY